tara:strand:- start:4408 stop:5025 length:618 start_codon:yes stop_codon:yes gene_type:complete
MRKLTSLFAVPILQTQIPITQNINSFINKQETKTIEPARNGITSKDNYILDNKKLAMLKKQILHEINFYKENILCVRKDINLYIKNSWIIIHKTNHFSHAHFHLNSFLSGILYIKTPANSGDITFYNNYSRSSLLPLLNIPFEKYNEYNSSNWTIPVNEGKLLLFPSGLQHSVPNNFSENTRISLAFNVLIKGDLKESEISHLNL